MRNFVLFFMMFAFGLFAKAQNGFVVSWLPANATVAANYGSNAKSSYTVYMEFNVADIANYKSLAISLDTIKQIQFHIADVSSITACNVVIRQGTDIANATDEVVQAVSVSNNLVEGWNYINLNSPYVVDKTKSLYIGYQLSLNGGYPFTVTDGTDAKQGWIRAGDDFQNIASSGYVFLIKAMVTSANLPENEIVLTSLNIPQNYAVKDSLSVRGTIQNLGSSPITSFKVSYEIDGLLSVDTITGVNIVSYDFYNFIHSKKYYLDSPRVSNVNVRVFEPNGNSDVELNNTMREEIKIYPYSSLIQRVVLHEVFTSATCPPCNPGNAQLKRVLDAVDFTKWACIKYQYDFPGYGDSYYTQECKTKGNFYRGISGVPTLFGDGSAYSNNPNSYNVEQFNKLAAIPAAVAMSATATISDKTVELNQISILPAVNMNNPNLRFFAAIVEKKTVNNEATNGEHEFHYVMKKFMTNVNGDVIDTLTDNQVLQLNNYSYTFNGNYRLPEDSYEPIDHTKEHSVEDFNNLMVVYWLQDIVTKEVFQAGKTDPNPGYTPVAYTVTVVPNSSSMGMVAGGHKYAANTMARIYAEPRANYRFVRWSNGATNPVYTFTVTQDTSFTAIFESTTDVTDIDDISSSITIHPNPVQDMLYITTDATIKQVEIYNLQGQLIRTETASLNEISTTNLSSGLYMLRITSEQGGVSVHKFIKQ